MSERQVIQMNDRRIKDYIESVNGYAVRRIYSQEEAEAFSQEILLTAVRAVVQAAKWKPFWVVTLRAANVTKSFRRTMGKRRAMFTYDIPEEVLQEES